MTVEDTRLIFWELIKTSATIVATILPEAALGKEFPWTMISRDGEGFSSVPRLCPSMTCDETETVLQFKLGYEIPGASMS